MNFLSNLSCAIGVPLDDTSEPHWYKLSLVGYVVLHETMRDMGTGVTMCYIPTLKNQATLASTVRLNRSLCRQQDAL